jgi:hypothetical protein
MNLLTIEEWLKGTIPGIILLGALGSLLAVVIIWVLKRLCFPFAVKLSAKSVASLLMHFAKPAISQLSGFIVKNGPDKLPLLFTLQVMKLIVSLFLSTCAFTLFCYNLFEPGEHLARPALLVPLVVCFLALWYGIRCIAVVVLPLYFDVENEVQQAKVKVLAARSAKASQS